MDKVKGTNLDEQFVAFGLMDMENFAAELKKENIIDDIEFGQITNLVAIIEKRCGFN